MSDGIVAIVVTYNRPDGLLNCLKAIEDQTKKVDAVYIIDNASYGTTVRVLRDYCYIKTLPDINKQERQTDSTVYNGIKIHYLRLPENVGESGGLSEGLKFAQNNRYKWYWLLTDDCLPEDITLEELAKEAADPGTAYIPDNFDINEKSLIVRDKVVTTEKSEKITFKGALLNNKIIETAGYPEISFYMYRTEDEYSLRLKKHGFNIVMVTNSIIYHPKDISLSHEKLKAYFQKRILYYNLRNSLRINRIYPGYHSFGAKFKYFTISVIFFCLLRWDLLYIMRKAVKDEKKNKMFKSKY